MKKAILDIKRLNSNDVVATSACNADFTYYTVYIRPNGSWNLEDMYTDDGFFYEYDEFTGKMVKRNRGSFMFYKGPVTVKAGKWYHVYTDGRSNASLIECKNPASHSKDLPKD